MFNQLYNILEKKQLEQLMENGLILPLIRFVSMETIKMY